MIFDLIPSKYILSSLSLNGVLFGAFAFQGVLFENVTAVSLEDSVSGTVEMFLDSYESPIKKLKKQIRKAVLEKPREISEFGDQVVSTPEETREVSFEALKKSSNQSPELRAFLRELSSKISERHNYPYSAQKLRQTGRVMVSFELLKTGDIKNVLINEKSDFKKLDESAFELIAGISRIENLPQSVQNGETMVIIVPVEYEL